MKSTLEFDLDDHEQRLSHLRCIKALDLCLVILGINTRLRDMLKNGPADDMYRDAIQDICEKITELEHKYGINLDELME